MFLHFLKLLSSNVWYGLENLKIAMLSHFEPSLEHCTKSFLTRSDCKLNDLLKQENPEVIAD